eukprot:990587-Amphidinium_carterae.1
MQHWKRKQEALQANSSSKRAKAEMIHQTVRVSPSDSRLVIIRAAASSSGSIGGASHSGGAIVPASWSSRFAVHSESEEPSEDSHQLRQESDSDEIPTVCALASRSLPSSLDSDMGYNPESMGVSRMVSLSNSMPGDLDGALGYTRGIDGVLRPWDLEVAPPPALVLQPEDLPPCPPIISNFGEVQDFQDDLQSSISSSLAVDLPSSPRSALGGVIGYAVDLFGVLTAFDMEPHRLDQTPSTPPSQATSQLLESGLVTFLPEHLPHSGGWITITVDHGSRFLIDTIRLSAATELLALTIAHTGGVSDSTIRGRLASKAAAAGMKNPGELLGLLWPGHSSALRSATGNAAVIKSILVSLAKKEGIVVEIDDPLSTHDPWAGHRAHQQQQGASASSKPSQANLNSGSELHTTDLSSLDSNSGGYLFIHATCLADALVVVRSCNHPVVLITQNGAHSSIQEKTLDAQIVTSTNDMNAKKVMQVTLVLHNIETLEVIQQAAILQIPSP